MSPTPLCALRPRPGTCPPRHGPAGPVLAGWSARGGSFDRFFETPGLVRLLARAKTKLVQLLAVDHSARASMKNAASCEN